MILWGQPVILSVRAPLTWLDPGAFGTLGVGGDQVDILGTPLGTELAYTDYHKVAEGYGGVGLCVRTPEEVEPPLIRAQQIAREGKPVLVNVWIGKSEFRKGSISI